MVYIGMVQFLEHVLNLNTPLTLNGLMMFASHGITQSSSLIPLKEFNPQRIIIIIIYILW